MPLKELKQINYLRIISSRVSPVISVTFFFPCYYYPTWTSASPILLIGIDRFIIFLRTKKNVKSELKKMDLEKRRKSETRKKRKKQLIKKINKRRVEKDKLPYTKKTLRSMSIKELRRELEVLK